MGFMEFVNEYKGMIGGLSIAMATVFAMLMNLRYVQHTDYKNKRNKDASFSSAIASELMDNAHNLMVLYLQIEKGVSSRKIIGYKQFSTHVYEHLLGQIGQLGSTLSFMVVDVYGDIKKMKSQLDELTDKQIIKKDDELLPDIQTMLIKTITTSIIMHLYADYKSGNKWMLAIRRHRLLWIERNIDEFFQYLGKTEQDVEFIDNGENNDLIFMRRFTDATKRQQIRELFKVIKNVLLTLGKEDPSKAQLTLRALGYRINNTLTSFLDTEVDTYDLLFEEEYNDYLVEAERKAKKYQKRKAA